MSINFGKFKVWCFALLAILAISITSCEKEAEVVSVDEFVDASIRSMQGDVVGKSKCLEFVFPVSIQFIDDSVAEVNSYEELFTTVKAWFEANEVEKSKENKPLLVFPVEVLNEDGELIQVESKFELRELKKECFDKTGKCGPGKKGRGFSCFKLVFPISMTIDGVTAEYADKATLKAAVRAYKEEAGADAVRPELAFPVTVQYEDGSTAEATSKDELAALKAACDEG